MCRGSSARGLKAPAVATVLNLARALDVPVAQLFGQLLGDDAIHVSRAAGRESPADEAAGYRLEPLSAGKGADELEGLLMEPPPSFTEDIRAEHDGEEPLFVIRGRVEVKFVDRVIPLDCGDALQFPGRLRTSSGASSRVAAS